MLLTYWLFHLIFTLPPTILLHLVLRPMLSSRDTFRLTFLVTMAVFYTLPWDSYIIKNKAWGYPDWSVLFTLFEVPIEEIFFFIIQTFFATYIYTLFTIPIIPALYILPGPNDLEHRSPTVWKLLRWGPSIGFLTVSIVSWLLCQPGHRLFYLTATGFWASPICGGLWALGGDHVIRRPYSIMISIIIPTIYLSFTDIIAIRSGTWFISPITSTGIFVAPDLPLEEFTFFGITNVLLVLGLAAIEKFDAIADTWPELYRRSSISSSHSSKSAYSGNAPISFWSQFQDLIQAINMGTRLEARISKFTPASSERIQQLNRTLEVLSVASKSFYSASFIFPNFCAIRSKFVILYGFCRETDDLIDHAVDKQEARKVVEMCKEFLDLLWPTDHKDAKDVRSNPGLFSPDTDLGSKEIEFQSRLEEFVSAKVPEKSRPTFLIFSTMRKILRREPFDELISGYEYDSIEFVNKEIKNEDDLMQYSRWVAGSVGEMCVSIMWWVYGASENEIERQSILRAANEMGCALQLINIARDVKEDAKISRIYVPKVWFEGQVDGLRLADWENLKNQTGLESFPYEIVAGKLLEIANQYQARSKQAIERLPLAFRPGIRAATRVYIEIGEKIRSRFQAASPGASHNDHQSPPYNDLKTATNDCAVQAIGHCEKQSRSKIITSWGEKEFSRGHKWNGDRIFLTQFQRLMVVARELWGLGGK
nr:bi-functional lycopene cyclase/phytoene synthase [Puccinia graminis f. sp. tritici]